MTNNNINNVEQYRTAECVTPGHPDKLCDQISDAILDIALYNDPESRVAIECLGGHKKLVIMGEITTTAKIDYEKIARKIAPSIKEVIINVVEQSPEISRGVDTGGAGDQGIMIGYATSETPQLIPLETVLSRKLAQYIYEKFPFDGKTQVTLKDDKIYNVLASFQNASSEKLQELVKQWITDQKYAEVDPDYNIFTNPAGDWTIGGFDADTGLTGRKLAVDNYGPRIPLGGGAFSGKDSTKVDRSAAYIARYVAVKYLKERNANEVLVRLSYAIGYSEPLEKTVIIDGKPEVISDEYDLTPKGIIEKLDLRKPQFLETSRWGHFGNNFYWEV
jgi:S-adenosylmethionine synthetase